MTDFLAQLIEAEKAAMHAPSGAKEATWSAVQASLLAGAPSPIDLPHAALPIAWIAGLIGGASGLAVVGYLAISKPAIVATPLPPPPPPVVIQAPPVEPPPIVEAPKKAPPRKRTRTSLAAQIQLLRKAQLAFSRGNAEQALSLVEEHRTKYPKTPLEQERTALEVLASCRLHKPHAQQMATEFVERWPQSPQVDHVRRTCLP